MHLRGRGRAAFKQALLWQFVLFLTLTYGWGDRAFAQSASDADSVIDQIPASVAAVASDRGDHLFCVQILYAGAIVWIISLMGSGKT
jgi:hypothetical protein